MLFLPRSFSSSYFFVNILLLTYKVNASSVGNKTISIESDSITNNDQFDLMSNEKRAKLRAFLARSFANGEKLDLLDHNALITKYNQIVNSSAVLFSKQLQMQKSILNNRIRYVHEKLINYFLNHNLLS